MKYFTTLFAALVCALSVLTISEACQRGLSWGVDDRLGPKIAKGLVEWYWHWQDGPNHNFNGKLEWVPCFWGPKYWSKWEQRKAEMKKDKPKHLLSFNEPEIPGQANMDPKYAAKLHMQEIQPWANKGVKVSSPQMVYKMDWLETFMKECNKRGCTVDFIALHWYGTTRDIKAFKSWISSVHKKFNKPIWVTEYGVTAASGSSQASIKKFHMDATAWMAKVGYVERSSWLGCFKINSPPDSYASNKNAFFNSNGSLRDLAYWYLYTNKPHKRSHSHRALPSVAHARRGEKHVDEDGAEIIDDDDEFELEEGTEIVDCDATCQARKEFISKYVDENGPLGDIDEDESEEQAKWQAKLKARAEAEGEGEAQAQA